MAHVDVLGHDIARRARLREVADHAVAVVGALLHAYLIRDVHEAAVVLVQREQIVVAGGATAIAGVLEFRIALDVRIQASRMLGEVRRRGERLAPIGSAVLSCLGHGRRARTVRLRCRRGRASHQAQRQSSQAHDRRQPMLSAEAHTSALRFPAKYSFHTILLLLPGEGSRKPPHLEESLPNRTGPRVIIDAANRR